MNNKIFLSSEIDLVAKSIAGHIPNHDKLKTVFVSTASETKGKFEELEWLQRNRQGLVDAGFNLTDYTITGKSADQIEEDLADFDIIHVNGGDANHLLKMAKASGFDKWIKKAIDSGKIYIGSSAGSICSCSDVAGYYKDGIDGKAGFGLVDVHILPHWGREDRREKYFGTRLEVIFAEKHKAILLRDTQYLKFEGDNFKIIDVAD